MCACLCVHVCVCVLVRERKREREEESFTIRKRHQAFQPKNKKDRSKVIIVEAHHHEIGSEATLATKGKIEGSVL